MCRTKLIISTTLKQSTMLKLLLKKKILLSLIRKQFQRNKLTKQLSKMNDVYRNNYLILID
jgi:hypothetical protein